MFFRDAGIFLIIQLSMIAFAHAEAYMEGSAGWKWNPKWWRIKLPRGYTYTAYHIYMYYVTFPLIIIVLPLFLAGWSVHLFLVLLASYLMGTTVEDFMWFVVNPQYQLSKWNPKETTWYPWVTIGQFSLPLAYIVRFVIFIGIIVLLYPDWISGTLN